MRAFLIPAALAAIVSTTPLAFAGDSATGTYTGTTTGVIKSVDLKHAMLRMDDGSVYSLPANPKNSNLKPGEKIRMIWDLQGGTRIVDHIAPVG